MKLSLLLLSCASAFSSSSAMLRKPTRYIPCPQVRPLRPLATQRVLTPLEIEKLKTQQAEQKAHNLQQEVNHLKQQLHHCQRHGCTQACIERMRKDCQQAHQEKLAEARKAFFNHQALDQRLFTRPLRPTAQK